MTEVPEPPVAAEHHPAPRRQRRSVLLATLLSTMTATSFQIFALAVLAVDIIDDLGLSRTGLGLLGSLNALVGAVTAPATGRLTDRIGARRAVVAALAISGLGMAVMAMSTTWMLLAASAALSGIPQGWGNPSTNALIAERVTGTAQGTVTGIKQSGVQFGIFLSGLTLPGLAIAIGWRGSAWVYAALFTILAIAVHLWLPDAARTPDGADPEPTDGGTAEGRGPERGGSESGAADGTPDDPSRIQIPGFIFRISVYAFCFGTAGGAVGRFFPLWANEVVGLSTSTAGLLVALGGLIGIASRIAAGRIARSWIDPARLLTILALIGACYCLLLAITTTVGAWILLPSTVFNAVGIGAWNAVAMLAVIITVPRAAAGRASGIVMVGFLGGLSVGSPVAGWVVDQFGTYQPVWLGAFVLSLFSAAIVGLRPDRATAVESDGEAATGHRPVS